MEFKVEDVKTGKVETWEEWAFVSPETNKSVPSGKQLSPKDRSAFVQMVKNGQTSLKSPFDSFGKSYYIIVDKYDIPDNVAVVNAWLTHPQSIKKIIIAIADMCITENDPHLKDEIYEQDGMLSVYNFCAPFMLTSLAIAKEANAKTGVGFDDIPGELIKWIWIYTLRAKNAEKYKSLISEIHNYYTCG